MQKDLFGTNVVSTLIPNLSDSKADFLQRYRLNLRLDQGIIAILLLVVAYVLVFSFGVESGKRYAMAEIKAERAMRERMARELGEKIFSTTNQPAQIASTLSPKAASGLPPTTVLIATTSEAVTAAAPVAAPNSGSAPKIEASTGTASKGKFGIQTVTFTSKAAAEKHIKMLAAKGYSALIIPKGKFQQVCVAGFENKAKAVQTMDKLKTQGLAPKDAFIRPISGV